jgi:phosphatidylserine/phosphatidylglycerophosphate/cardiolipin synthase-like enzyme
MTTNIAFFLRVPGSEEADPYDVMAKYGPNEELIFNRGISVKPPESSRDVKAVCPGRIWQISEPDGSRTLRLEPTIELLANGWERVTAFEYRGVDGLSMEILETDYRRAAETFARVGDELTFDEFKQEVELGVLGVEVLDEDIGTAIGLVSREFEFIEFRVVTSPAFRRVVGGPNHCDPAAFWAFHSSPAGRLRETDRTFVSDFVKKHFAGRSVLEFRDEYNTPLELHIGQPPPARDDLTYNLGSKPVRVGELSRGTLVLQQPAGSKVEVSAAFDYCLWDSHNGVSASQSKLVITVPNGPEHIVVIALKLADWFAPQQAEFDTAFPASAVRPLPQYTRGNKLHVLVDGKEYFDDLSAELDALDDSPSDHFWHHAGWSLEPTFLLDRIHYQFVRDLIKRYRDSLVLMLWKSGTHLPPKVYDSNSNAISLAAPERCLHDAKVNAASAVHMKVVTLKNRNGLVGYCGGIDVWPDRETDRSHSNSMCDAMHLVLHHRWVDQRGDPTVSAFAAPAVQEPIVGGTIVAQIARTVPPRSSFVSYGYAKDGDSTLKASLFNAIARAHRFIYIEDQYFANGHVAYALEQRLRSHLPFLIVVLPYKNWDPLATSEPALDAKSYLDPLRRNYPDQVRVCYLENQSKECIYVHAKLMIVDDLFVSCGSANIDHRGLGTNLGADTSVECNLMCVDEKVNAAGSREFPQKMRMKLWAEHLELAAKQGKGVYRDNDPTLLDPLVAFNHYWKKSEPCGKVRFFPPSTT